MQYITTNYEETLALAEHFAKALKPASVLFLSGELGAGKTAFCSGLAKGLACIDEAASPTYSIVNFYRGATPLAHFDMYRITAEEDLETTGYFDYLEQGVVVAVEWYEHIASFVDAPDYYIHIAKTDETTRTITIKQVAE